MYCFDSYPPETLVALKMDGTNTKFQTAVLALTSLSCVSGLSPFTGIADGSETSGGVDNVLAEHIFVVNSGLTRHDRGAERLKTA